jgi:hypothetical protein
MSLSSFAGPVLSAIITVTAIIRNTGAPSIAELSSASMEIGERTVDAVVIPPPRDQVNLLVGTKKGEGMTFLSVDFLPRKAMSQPIPTGGAVSGFIQLFVAKVEREEVYSNGIITLTFKDVLDNKYTLKSAKGDQGGRQPILNIDKLQERGY